MNRKIISAAVAAVVFFSAASGSYAYMLYSEGMSAVGISSEYTPDLILLNSELNEAVRTYSLTPPETTEQPGIAVTGTNEVTGSAEAGNPEEQVDSAGTEEAKDAATIYTELIKLAQEYHTETGKNGRELAGKLMDYDVLLKKLNILLGRYEYRLDNAEKLEKLALTGECDAKTAQGARDEADSLYYEIKALLFDISVLKADIEAVTGEPLKDDFDFNSVYLITDALKLDPESFVDRSQLGTLYVPVGAALEEYEAADCTSPLNTAVQAYYSLGTAMREYISAAAAEKEGRNSVLLGELTRDELRILTEAVEDCFLVAAQAKAEFSKALLALDEASGRAVSGTVISGQEAGILSETVSENARGVGMWLVLRTSGGTEFLPISYPTGTYPIDEDDKARYSYKITYDDSEIGSAVCGNSCAVSEIPYRDGLNKAQVEFFRNGVSVGIYRVNIFTPYGEFE